jgi:hypothetical protein
LNDVALLNRTEIKMVGIEQRMANHDQGVTANVAADFISPHIQNAVGNSKMVEIGLNQIPEVEVTTAGGVDQDHRVGTSCGPSHGRNQEQHQ